MRELHLAITLLNNNSTVCYSTLEVSNCGYAREWRTFGELSITIDHASLNTIIKTAVWQALSSYSNEVGTERAPISYFVGNISVTLQFPPPFMGVNRKRRVMSLWGTAPKCSSGKILVISDHGLAKAIP